MRASRIVTLRCNHPSDGALCSVAAHSFARESGMDHIGCCQLATSVAELVSNAVRHAGGGEVTLRCINGNPPVIEVAVRDDGPGISDVDEAMRDGWSGAGPSVSGVPRNRGLGMGLGAVRRLMSAVEVRTSPAGTTVVARKRIGRGL